MTESTNDLFFYEVVPAKFNFRIDGNTEADADVTRIT